jgi:hypothetical protein
VVVLGIYGAVFSRKHYERNRFHTTIMAGFRDALEASLTGAPLRSIRDAAEKKHNARFPWLSGWRLHLFWDGLSVAVAVAGLVAVFVVSAALLRCRV